MKGLVLLSIVLIVSIASIVSIAYYNTTLYEGFVEEKCMEYDDCKTCAEKPNCTWCTSSKRCLSNSEIRGTDTLCNQVNLVHTPSLCHDMSKQQRAVKDSAMTLPYQLDDMKKPPNVYMAKDMEYTNETVMAETEQLKKELANLKMSLPGLMAQTVHEQMKPMVKGITCDPAPFR